MAERRAAPDWRDQQDYHHLTEMQRPAFAWELLRRNPRYRADSLAAAPYQREAGATVFVSAEAERLAAQWGLSFLRGG